MFSYLCFHFLLVVIKEKLNVVVNFNCAEICITNFVSPGNGKFYSFAIASKFVCFLVGL